MGGNTWAIERAGAVGDVQTLTLARNALRPFGWRWWRGHKALAAVLATTLGTVAWWAGWQWAVAILALLVVFALSQRPIVAGLPLGYPEEGGDEIALAGLAVAGRYGGFDPMSGPPAPARPAATRDGRYWRASVALLGAAAVALPPWAAGAYGPDVLLRVGSATLAALVAVCAVWQWPHLGTAPPQPGTDRDGFGITVKVAPVIFIQFTASVWITNSVLSEAVRRRRERAGAHRDRRPGLVRRLLAVAPAITAVALLIGLAVVPDRRQTLELALALGGTALDVLVLAGGAVLSVRGLVGALGRRDPLGLAAALGQLAAAAALFFLAHRLGMLPGWLDPLH